jgi:hypothetical protein
VARRRRYDPFGRTQHAPRWYTIVLALVLILVGLLATYGTLLPDTIGVWAFIVATVLLTIGVFIEGI